jgi:hypothetical protein
MKTCSKCKETKELIEFYSTGSYCKICRKNKSKQIYQSNPEAQKNRMIKWKDNNKEWVIKHHQCTKEWATKISGVYAIFDNECLYVGESKRVNARIADHKYYTYHPESKVHKANPIYSNLQQHSNLEFRILEETPNHKEREQYWINQLKPKYNEKI